ncbi:MAG TPA: XdhC family protein [Gammaproteobacteria bacterium]|jgi:xanthine/CO dehydrogenase XdhC/CoxF family maturation factor
MNSRFLVEHFEACRGRSEPLVLVTVWETLGSTYSKAGTRMLITSGGESRGLVSGGCLESDLAERARDVLETRQARTVTYDLRDEADELFGLGIGCNGLISVLLQPVFPETSYEPLASIARALVGLQPGAVATVIEASDDAVAPGAALVLADDDVCAFGVPSALAATLEAGCREVLNEGVPRLVSEPAGLRVLLAPIKPVPQVLILGAGLDAVPLVNIVAELGWRVSIADHRPAYLKRGAFSRAEQAFDVRPETLAADVALTRFDAIVVMSHHLATDREYLRQLADVDITFIGLLGPPARKERLLGELGDAGRKLGPRLHAPVGIDIGADTAESIAVSIAAEIQQVLA